MMKAWCWIRAFCWRAVQKAAFKIADGLIAVGDWADARSRYARREAGRKP